MSAAKAKRSLGATSALMTPGSWLDFAEKLYVREQVALGQVAAEAHDEALYLILHALGLPLDSEAVVLRKKLTANEREKLEIIFRRRVFDRILESLRKRFRKSSHRKQNHSNYRTFGCLFGYQSQYGRLCFARWRKILCDCT